MSKEPAAAMWSGGDAQHSPTAWKPGRLLLGRPQWTMSADSCRPGPLTRRDVGVFQQVLKLETTKASGRPFALVALVSSKPAVAFPHNKKNGRTISAMTKNTFDSRNTALVSGKE